MKDHGAADRLPGAPIEVVPPTLDCGVVEGASQSLVDILSSVQETAYSWNLSTDEIEWESNAAGVLGVRSAADIATGNAFQFLVATEHLGRRREAITGHLVAHAGNGSSYRVQYRFLPHGRRSQVSLWLEDHGRCWHDNSGRPIRARGVVRIINERYWEEQRLLYRSDHDELTGQLNRIRLLEALGAIITRAERTKQPCAFLVAAINNLAVINETFGFDVGDEVIAATGNIIKGRLRGGDSIGRYSSNKFGIILNECSLSSMRIAAERFIRAVRETAIRTSACPLTASISIGGVMIPDHAESVQQALSNSLYALDRAKARHGECFIGYEPSPSRETARQRNIKIADEVVSAIDEKRMLLALQPIVSAKTRKPAIYECLLRLQRHDGEIVSAGEFIPVAEQLGLARLVDKRSLELAVEVLKDRPEIRLALNVSSLTTSDHEWLVALHRLTGGRRTLTERLTIEITETAAIHDLNQSMSFVDTLKDLGCQVAIDDFGAGYTSFRHLKVLNTNMVKIDGAFVRDVIADKSDQIFIRTMAELARTLKMETVAEWVGDEETARFLTEAGIDYLQGYLFGKPVLARDLPRSAG